MNTDAAVKNVENVVRRLLAQQLNILQTGHTPYGIDLNADISDELGLDSNHRFGLLPLLEMELEVLERRKMSLEEFLKLKTGQQIIDFIESLD